jgi:hypothetical protein
MKYLFALIILSFVSFQCFSQRTSDLKFGIGLPYAFGNGNSDEIVSVNTTHTITGFPTLSVEKPIGFGLPREKKFSINPGLSYFFFKEKELIDRDRVDVNNNLNHHSVNIYSKWLYQMKLQRKSEAYLYFGAITALHIFTKTKGTRISSGQNVEEPLLEIEVNDSGVNFYDLFYYGAIVGFQPNAKITQMLKPSFELKFYPGLVTRKGDKQSTIEFTVLIGYRK